MKKEPSNSEEENKRSKHLGLPRKAILRGKKNFERLFSSSSVLRGSLIDLKYQLIPELPGEFKIAFVVGKRLGKALHRNKAKRQMREAFRHHQHLFDVHQSSTIGIHAVLLAKRLPMSTSDVFSQTEHILHQLNVLVSTLPKTDVV